MMRPSNSSNSIAFRNIQQAALFELEIKGQLSDGMWENAKPHDHWEPWSDADCVVATDRTNIGRNFYAYKENYGLNSLDLLDCIGGRMIAIAKLAQLTEDFEQINILKDFFETTLDKDNKLIWAGLPEYEGEYWDLKRLDMSAAVMSLEKIHGDAVLYLVMNSNYFFKHLREDLADMAKIIKIRK